jgi:hypothetical protein
MGTISKSLKSKIIDLARGGKNTEAISTKLVIPRRQVVAIIAAEKRKWRKAQQRALKKAREAKTFTKYKLSKEGYKCISFDTKKGYEYKGVVDLVAVKRDNKKPDRLRVILVQVKGGSAKIKKYELSRLKSARRNIEIDWLIAEKPKKKVIFKPKNII